MRRIFWFAPALAGVWLAGCAAVPRDHGASAIDDRLAARGAPFARLSPAARGAALPATPLTVQQAVELAFTRSPTMHELYAELGVNEADVYTARELPNPTLAYARLSGDGLTQVTRSVSLGFTDLLLLPSRARFAGMSRESTRDRVASRLLALESDVRAAWYDSVAAAQSAEVAILAARAASASAEYAKRLDAAGNLPPRSLALELAAAAEGEIAAARARAEATRTRARLAALIGLSTRDGWSVAARLPVPPASAVEHRDLAEQALAVRLDIVAARRELAALDSALTVTRLWRWLGEFEVGYQRETDTDGARLRGPTFALKLPLFGFNRAGVLRAESARDAARAHLAALELEVRNDIALALDRMATAREVADIYRTALVPQREAATAHTLEEVNFMLSGAFELLATRREQYAAYREYVDAVRDYWLAHVDLERALGAHLAPASEAPPLDLGIPGERP